MCQFILFLSIVVVIVSVWIVYECNACENRFKYLLILISNGMILDFQ